MNTATHLRSLGLSSKEADLYLYAVVHGAVKPGDVTRDLGLGRSEAYRALDDLASRGFLTKTLEKLARFESVPPERVFDVQIAKVDARRADLVHDAAKVAHDVKTLQKRDVTQAAATTSHVHGRRDAVAQIVRMLREARQGFQMIATHPIGLAHDDRDEMGLRSTLLARAKQGLPMRSITTMTELDLRVAVALNFPSLEQRHLETDAPLVAATSDRRELIMWHVFDPNQDAGRAQDVALVTNAPDFVAGHLIFFEALWRVAHSLDALGGTVRHARSFPESRARVIA